MRKKLHLVIQEGKVIDGAPGNFIFLLNAMLTTDLLEGTYLNCYCLGFAKYLCIWSSGHKQSNYYNPAPHTGWLHQCFHSYLCKNTSCASLVLSYITLTLEALKSGLFIIIYISGMYFLHVFVFRVSLLFCAGHPKKHQAHARHPNDRGAEATTVNEIAVALALTVNSIGSVTGNERRGRAGTEIGRERGGVPAAQIGTKTDENAEEVVVAAESEEANGGKKKETVEMTEAGRRTGTTTRTEAVIGRSPGRKRAEGRATTGDTKTTGRDTKKRGRPKGPVGVAARKKGTRVERRRPRDGTAATAERETGREMENGGPTNGAVAKTGATTRGSPVMIRIINIVNARGVGALSKSHLAAIFSLLFSVYFLPSCLICHLC